MTNHNNIERKREYNRQYYHKNKAMRQEYNRKYYQANREQLIAENTERWIAGGRKQHRKRKIKLPVLQPSANERRRQVYNALKEAFGCLNPDCKWEGHLPAYMLDFHHKDPKQKVKPVSQLIGMPRRMLAEIKKCTCLCANCHRRVTWGELDESQLPLCKIEGHTLRYSN